MTSACSSCTLSTPIHFEIYHPGAFVFSICEVLQRAGARTAFCWKQMVS